ncbi:hypothetical protein QEH59_02900 [Coraliomargarita sp. SDUM461004]|uniref:DUF7305 domain-containing protein n=1 Tax=Thalassobacterium sedimentorum TaxID=3041258 RepID=A0ABU1AHU0_9BACT|nr:hypothetical protein [Coraliomargarita sp. SDUM461004]MDQ8193356.1 hypothetical protein [Coraliomargarita sp. SDUM461004]
MSHFIHANESVGAGSRQRGSALLTALIFSFVVVTLMSSYLFLASSDYRVSTRAFLLGASFNLAEGGVDHAIYALNQGDNSGWRTGVDRDRRSYWSREFGPYDLGGNIQGYIRVVILDPTTSAPEIFSEGEANGHVSGRVTKQIRVALSGGFYPFRNGFNSKMGIVLKGSHVTFDSYDSRVGGYGLGNRNSEITVATVSVESDAINIGNADVYGYVATGGGAPNVGPQGAVTSYENPGVIDWSRITTDFYAEFPPVEAPSLNAPSTSLPSWGYMNGGDYLLSSFSMSRGVLYVMRDSRIVVTGDMKVSGNALVYIANGASLQIYAAGDVDISGNGIYNDSQIPSNLLIFGTHDEVGEQQIRVQGNGFLAAAIYAPNSEVILSGGGSSGRVYGGVAAYEAKLTGRSHFSYDEALEDYNLGVGGYQVVEWVELSGVGLNVMRVNMELYGL